MQNLCLACVIIVSSLALSNALSTVAPAEPLAAPTTTKHNVVTELLQKGKYMQAQANSKVTLPGYLPCKSLTQIDPVSLPLAH